MHSAHRNDPDRSSLPPAALKCFTWRSFLLGTAAVLAVCALTPYNDFVLSDVSLASGYLPLAAILIEFLLVVGINAPLHRWAPRLALSRGELAVIVMMTLIACSLPNWGLMRFLIPMPVSPFRVGVGNETFWQAFINLNLPGWLFPVEDVLEGRSDPVVLWFYQRVPQGETIPFGAWIRPLMAWGVFVAAMIATLVALARLVLDQWAVNERLPFPLVQVQAALLEEPESGSALNRLFRSRALWVGLLAVFAIHSFNALNVYLPKNFPRIPLGYDFTSFIPGQGVPGQPLSYLQTKVKKAALSFIVIGVTYFIRSKVAFSLWGAFLLVNVVEVIYGTVGAEIPSAAWGDQHLGACVAFVGAILWIGRHHWLVVLKNALGFGKDSRYRLSFWIVVAGVLVMLAWLRMLGVQLWVAGLIVLFILMSHLVVSRVLAETGLPFFRCGIAASQVYTNLPIGWVSGRDVYFSSVFTVLGPLTTRDGIMGFALHGLGIAQGSGATDRRRSLGSIIVWTLILGCVVAGLMTLYCQYSYPTPTTPESVPSRNYFGAEYIPRRDIASPMHYYSEGKHMPKSHKPLPHIIAGFILATILEAGSLRWTNWPILPVGYIVSYGAFIGNAWFSVFMGWLVKTLIVRWGGSTLFIKARPLFVGMIFGEALAAGIWLIINAILVLNGLPIRRMSFMF